MLQISRYTGEYYKYDQWFTYILHYSQKCFLRLEAALVTYESSLYADNAISQSQPQWTGPSPVDDFAVNREMLNTQQLAIDEGTISVSSNYSQEYVRKNISYLLLTPFKYACHI